MRNTKDKWKKEEAKMTQERCEWIYLFRFLERVDIFQLVSELDFSSNLRLRAILACAEDEAVAS